MKKIFLFFCVWQIFIFGFTAKRSSLLELKDTYTYGRIQGDDINPAINSRANFDGMHYLSISQNGYGHAEEAFFPMYPKLIGWLSTFGYLPIYPSLLISLASFFASLVVFKKLIELDFNKDVSTWAILAILCFPASFFFGSVYTESIFLLVSLLCLYSARKSRWLLAIFFASLASYTRLVGVFLIISILIEMYQQKNIKMKYVALSTLSLSGIYIFMLTLSAKFGDPFAFIHVQKQFGQERSSELIPIYQVLWRYLKILATVNKWDLTIIPIVAEVLTSISAFVITFLSIKKIRPSYIFLGLASIILPTLTGTFASMPRYVLVDVPVWIMLGLWLSKADPRFKKIYLVCNILFSYVFVTLFANGHWIS